MIYNLVIISILAITLVILLIKALLYKRAFYLLIN